MKKKISGTIYNLLHSFQVVCSKTSSHDEFMQIKNEYTDKISTEISNLIDQFVQKCEEKSYKHVHGNVESEDAFTTREDILQIADELKTEVSK